jgi:hypothetical protein
MTTPGRLTIVVSVGAHDTPPAPATVFPLQKCTTGIPPTRRGLRERPTPGAITRPDARRHARRQSPIVLSPRPSAANGDESRAEGSRISYHRSGAPAGRPAILDAAHRERRGLLMRGARCLPPVVRDGDRPRADWRCESATRRLSKAFISRWGRATWARAASTIHCRQTYSQIRWSRGCIATGPVASRGWVQILASSGVYLTAGGRH